MPLALRRWLDTRLFQLRGPQPGPIVLVHRKVYILPTRHGVVYVLVLLLMLLGSLNYTLSLGFVLTFLLAGLGLNGILHTFRNMANLRVAAMRPGPVFAGETAHFPLRIENPSRVPRAALEALTGGGDTQVFDVPAGEESVVSLPVAAERRGRLGLGRVVLQTHYPLGLFRAWSYIELDVECIVFPRPETPGVPLPSPTGEHGEGTASMEGNEDFFGLREYHAGDSPRRIAWKADARDRGLLSKVFTGRAASHLWLDWHALPAALDHEARLSRLTRWVLEADLQGSAYGLRLPSLEIEPASGIGHRTACLEALALFEHDRPA